MPVKEIIETFDERVILAIGMYVPVGTITP